MAIQFRNAQYANDSITAAKVDLANGTYNFAEGATLRASSPSASTDVANKAYVDAALQGAYWKDACMVASTANLTLSGEQTIDGVAVTDGDRVLVKNQTAAEENGIYVCATGAWARAEDMDASAEFPSAAVFVMDGTANADRGYICTNDDPPVVGTDAINFTQFTGLGQITAGAGLSKSGDQIDVELTANKGLAFSAAGIGGTLEVDIDDTAGLDFISGAIGMVLNDASLEFVGGAGGGVAVKFDANYGISLDATNGLRIDLAANKGLVFDSGDIAVQLDAAGAIDFSSGALKAQVDDATIEISSNALQVKDDSLSLSKMSWRPSYEEFTSQSGTTITLAQSVLAVFTPSVKVYRNGQRLQAKESSPSGNTEYTVSGSTVTFGSALDSADLIQVDYIY